MSEPLTPSRPVLRWHGGKWMLAPWIIANFPEHRTYVEPYGGAASVLIRKPRAYAEVYNDLDRDVVALFEILRDPKRGGVLLEQLKLTPFARAEFLLSYQRSDDPIEQARRLVVRSFMGFGSDGHNAAVKTGFRADSNKSGTTRRADARSQIDINHNWVDMNTPAQARDINHPCPKPIALWQWMFQRLTFSDGELVFDPFLGAGTTIIVAEMEHRRCAGIELDPIYVDVIIERWQNFTGREATLESTGKTFAETKKARHGKKTNSGRGRTGGAT